MEQKYAFPPPTDTEQSSVQHLGKEQSSVCRNEHNAEYFYCKLKPYDSWYETGEYKNDINLWVFWQTA